jgi:hypothetical protein
MEENKLNFTKKPSNVRESAIKSRLEEPINEAEPLRPLQSSQIITEPIKKSRSNLVIPSP